MVICLINLTKYTVGWDIKKMPFSFLPYKVFLILKCSLFLSDNVIIIRLQLNRGISNKQIFRLKKNINSSFTRSKNRNGNVNYPMPSPVHKQVRRAACKK